MRFGQQLSAHMTPEWHKQYLDYTRLKEVLYCARDVRLRCGNDSEEIIPLERDFFEQLHRELRKVERFYLARETDSQAKFEELQGELAAALAAQQGNAVPRRQRAPTRRRATVVIDRVRRRRAGTADAEVDVERARARSMASLRKAFREFYLSLILLQNYEKVNVTGFRKICKKYDKEMLTAKSTTEFYQGEVKRESGISQRTIVEDLIHQTETIVIDKLEGGDRGRAMAKLRVPPFDAQISPMVSFRLGLWLGTLLVSLVALILGAVYVDVVHTDRGEEMLRLFRFGLIILLMVFFIGVNFVGFRSTGVNHVLIFEVNPRDNLPGLKIMEVSAMFMAIWMLCVLLYIYLPLADVSTRSRLAIPIAPAAALVLFLLNPFHVHLYTARRWLVRRLVRIACAPFFFVEFADFWLADQLNSVAVSFGDLEYLVCFYIFDWRDAAPYPPNKNCGVVTYGLRPIVLALPAWFRFAQCLRRYRDTKQMNPHLINAGKYSTTFFVVLYSSLVSWEKGENDGMQQYSGLFVMWVLCAFISTLYTSYWDLFQDWGLMKRGLPASQRLLRADLVYSKKWFYYAAMVGDVGMRFLWTLSVSVGEGGLINSQVLKTVLSIVEVFRRFIWNFFRLENEHLNNVGEFRAVRDISIVPLPRQAAGEEDDGAANATEVDHTAAEVQLSLEQDEALDVDEEDLAADVGLPALSESMPAQRISLPMPLRQILASSSEQAAAGSEGYSAVADTSF